MKKLKINTQILKYLFILIPFFKPYFVIQFNMINKLYNVLQIFCAILIFLRLILNKEKLSWNVLNIIFMEILLIFVTFYNDGEVISIIKEVVQISCLICFIDSEVKRDSKNLLNALLKIFKLLIYVNFITQIFYPQGFNIGYRKIWFLGNKNSFSFYVLTGILLEYISLKDRKFKITDMMFFIISIISIIMSNSATSMISIFCIMIFILFPNNFEKIFFNIKNYILIYVILFLNIVVLNVQNYFVKLISSIFNKSPNFSGRINVWQSTIDFIKSKPFLGYGFQSENIRTQIYNNWELVHSHNMILDLMYQGGMVLMFLFIYHIKIVINKLRLCNDLKIKRFIEWFIFVFFIGLLTEVYSLDKIFIIFTIIYNINYFISEKRREGTCQELKIL